MSSPTHKLRQDFLAELDAWQRDAGLRDADVARLLDISKTHISLVRSSKRGVGRKLLAALRKARAVAAVMEPVVSNAREVPVPGRKVPLVSWARAGEAVGYEDLCRQLEEWVYTETRDPNAFSVELEGDSMEPRFFAGDRVVVTPNGEPRNGDFVLAKLSDDGVVFKRFHRTGPEGSIIRLESLNPNYAPREVPLDQFVFIYPAVEVLTRLRR